MVGALEGLVTGLSLLQPSSGAYLAVASPPSGHPPECCILDNHASLLTHAQRQTGSFLPGLAEGKSQKQAYVDAGYAARGNSAEAEAARLIRNDKVAARVANLKAEHAARSAITVDTIISELNEARELALRVRNPTAMINASMAKAKLLGLDRPDQHKHRHHHHQQAAAVAYRHD